jgi:hypothetical protein
MAVGLLLLRFLKATCSLAGHVLTAHLDACNKLLKISSGGTSSTFGLVEQ